MIGEGKVEARIIVLRQDLEDIKPGDDADEEVADGLPTAADLSAIRLRRDLDFHGAVRPLRLLLHEKAPEL